MPDLSSAVMMFLKEIESKAAFIRQNTLVRSDLWRVCLQ